MPGEEVLRALIPESQRVLILQDTNGWLYALDWLRGEFLWAVPLGGESGLTHFEDACSEAADGEWPFEKLSEAAQTSLRHETARLLAGPDGGLLYIDYSGEFVPVPDLSIAHVLQQTPFTTPLFPEHYLLGKQTQKMIALNQETGELITQSSDAPTFEIATSTLTISAVRRQEQEKVDWAFSLTSIGSLGESPMRPSEAECLAAAASGEMCLPSLVNNLGWTDSFERGAFGLSCAEVLIEGALRRATHSKGKHVTIDLCAVASALAAGTYSDDCEFDPTRRYLKLTFPAPILNIYPARTLQKFKSFTLGDGLLSIEPNTFPVHHKLFTAVNKRLKSCAARLARTDLAASMLEDNQALINIRDSAPEFSPESQSFKQQAVRLLLTSSNLLLDETPKLPTAHWETAINHNDVLYLPTTLPMIEDAPSAAGLRTALPPSFPSAAEGGIYVAILNPSLSNWLLTGVIISLICGLFGWWVGRQSPSKAKAGEFCESRKPTPTRATENSGGESSSSSTRQRRTTENVRNHDQSMLTDILRSSTTRLTALLQWNSPQSKVPPNAPLHQMLDNGKFNKTFTEAVLVGRGGFGSVYRVKHVLEPGNTLYALKVVMCEASIIGDLRTDRHFREVATNRDILSKYVVRYFTWWCEEPQFLPNHLKLVPEVKPLLEKVAPKQQSVEEADMFATRRGLEGPTEARRAPITTPARPQTVGEMLSSQTDHVPLVEVDEESDGIYFLGDGSSECEETNVVEEEASVRPLPEPPRSATCQICLIIQMEWCPGMTLRHWLQHPSRVIPPLLAQGDERRYELCYFKHLSKGLRDIHAQGIVHRDIKPENIFVHKERLKIGDFGLSKLVRSQSTVASSQSISTGAAMSLASDIPISSTTATGAVIGTPSYSAPEGGVECTEKADIYSCGLVLIEMLSHKLMTSHERHELLSNFRHHGVLPSYFSEDAFKGWVILIKAMCAYNPSERPAAEKIVAVLKQAAMQTRSNGTYELNVDIVSEVLA